MDHVGGKDRNQLIVTCLNEMVAETAFVRIIDVFVDALDLKQFDFKYCEHGIEGRPPFHPAHLLKLYLYGYQNGIRSCRKLELLKVLDEDLLKFDRPAFSKPAEH